MLSLIRHFSDLILCLNLSFTDVICLLKDDSDMGFQIVDVRHNSLVAEASTDRHGWSFSGHAQEVVELVRCSELHSFNQVLNRQDMGRCSI